MYDIYPGKLWTKGHEERVYYVYGIIVPVGVSGIKVSVYYLTDVWQIVYTGLVTLGRSSRNVIGYNSTYVIRRGGRTGAGDEGPNASEDRN